VKVGREGSVLIDADDTEGGVGPEVVKVGSEAGGTFVLFKDIGVRVEG
jgi:hypothetical protein